MALSPFQSFGSRAAALATAAVVGASAFAFPAAAQEVLSDAQCVSAKGAVIATLREFRGKMSAPLAESLGQFAKTCDLKTNFERVPGQDDGAWDTFRLRITNIRISAAGAPDTLARR
jgi:hypothetical protein